MESQEETYAKKLVLLRIPPRDTPIYFVVAADIYRPDEPVDDGDEYFYDEHTCPTNWLRDVEMVIAGDSADPHGFAEWVASIPAGDLLDDNEHDRSGNTKLDTLDREPYGAGGWVSGPGILARRVLALFGIGVDGEDGDANGAR